MHHPNVVQKSFFLCFDLVLCFSLVSGLLGITYSRNTQ
jgi:hypothetical protein